MEGLTSSNPAFNLARKVEGTGRATVQGTINRIFLCTILMFLGAVVTWVKYSNGDPKLGVYLMVGLIGSIVCALITAFKTGVANITVPLYSIFEGLLLGAISAQFSYLFNGIVIEAILITVGILLVMLLLYKLGILRATGRFRKVVFIATLGIGVTYLLTFLLSLFGIRVPFIFTNSPIGIAISIGVIIIAALNFILDFDNIEYITSVGAPKKMEWIGAFGIMTTMVWMYIEIIRLLAILKDEN